MLNYKCTKITNLTKLPVLVDYDDKSLEHEGSILAIPSVIKCKRSRVLVNTASPTNFGLQ